MRPIIIPNKIQHLSGRMHAAATAAVAVISNYSPLAGLAAGVTYVAAAIIHRATANMMNAYLDFQHQLKRWCDDAEGTDEYLGRRQAAARIARCYYYYGQGTLNLKDLGLTSLPEGMEKLTRVHHIHLCGNQLTTLPTSIAQLKGLESLHLKRNPQLKDLPPEFQNTPLYMCRD